MSGYKKWMFYSVSNYLILSVDILKILFSSFLLFQINLFLIYYFVVSHQGWTYRRIISLIFEKLYSKIVATHTAYANHDTEYSYETFNAWQKVGQNGIQRPSIVYQGLRISSENLIPTQIKLIRLDLCFGCSKDLFKVKVNSCKNHGDVANVVKIML